MLKVLKVNNEISSSGSKGRLKPIFSLKLQAMRCLLDSSVQGAIAFQKNHSAQDSNRHRSPKQTRTR